MNKLYSRLAACALIAAPGVAWAGEGASTLGPLFAAVGYAFLTALILTVQLVYSLGVPRLSWKKRFLLTLAMLTADLLTGALVFWVASRYRTVVDHPLAFILAALPGFLLVYWARARLNCRRREPVSGH